MGFFPIKKIFWWFFPIFFKTSRMYREEPPPRFPLTGVLTHKKPRALTQGYNYRDGDL